MYYTANIQSEAFEDLLWVGIHIKLVSGELVARGFREPFSHDAPYFTIPRHHWRVLQLERGSERAGGGGVAYAGITIGKPARNASFGEPNEVRIRPAGYPWQRSGFRLADHRVV
jgi:hypothetical protein